MKQNNRTRLSALCTVLFLTGCGTLAPDYVRPQQPVPAHVNGSARSQAAVGFDVSNIGWREVFTDSRLQQVIATALGNNRDLRVALLNIEQARAQYRIQRAALLPEVDLSASQNVGRSSASTSQSGRSDVSRVYSADIGISSWELDIFGRLRSLNEEALQTYLSTEQAQRATRLSLVAEVADAWLTVGAYRSRLDLSSQTLANQQQVLRLTQFRRERGTASGLEVSQAQTSVETARGDVASTRTELAKARNALELLVGAPVSDALLPGSLAENDAGIALIAIPEALDSTALLQRPDVLQAEHTLQAANANIGAARAAFFPTISLTASTGRASTELNELFRGGNGTWSFVPSITVPIFQGGALRAQLDVSKIQTRIEVAEYEKAIQTAFSEVADALAEREQLQERLDAQRALVVSSQRSYDLANARYRTGIVSFLEALDSQRSLYAAQQTQIDLYLVEASNRVLLFKALGGGADARP
ncbi:efflux transporter outer membrane subunit [Pectobacterium actinidiae]|uniref:Efflux transporter outer membrane subunit n=1 Tax=Pectobacterium actinidiae TaxID=1507808 RepID=A0ABW8G5X7_9GAMM